jgi:Zn-dependent peptidase ImmA (M78 family)
MARLDAMAKRIPALLGEMRDYEQGYELAVRLRALLGNEDDCFDIEATLQEWGIPVQEIELSDAELDGASVCDDVHGPVIFLNRRSLKASASWGRRMVLAHELCHLLFDRPQAVPLAIISGPWAPAPIERRANAFAAELLLPLAGIKRRLGPQPSDVTDAQLEELKSAYEVGTTTCLWHLHNRNRLRWGE